MSAFVSLSFFSPTSLMQGDRPYSRYLSVIPDHSGSDGGDFSHFVSVFRLPRPCPSFPAHLWPFPLHLHVSLSYVDVKLGSGLTAEETAAERRGVIRIGAGVSIAKNKVYSPKHLHISFVWQQKTR